MKKFANIRLPVICACFLICGIAAGYLLHYYSIDLTWLTAVVPIAAVIVAAFSLLLKKGKLRAVIFTLLASLFFVFGVLGCYFRLTAYSKTEIIAGNVYRITGTVAEKGLYSSGEYVIIDGAEANGVALRSSIRLPIRQAQLLRRRQRKIPHFFLRRGRKRIPLFPLWRNTFPN